MKASELIEELKKQIEEHGDKEVRFAHEEECCPYLVTEEVYDVTFDDAYDARDVIVLR